MPSAYQWRQVWIRRTLTNLHGLIRWFELRDGDLGLAPNGNALVVDGIERSQERNVFCDAALSAAIALEARHLPFAWIA